MHNQETKICQNCKTDFIIEPVDFEFYEKISVPPPTWCPECRMRRRFFFRNERVFYHRKCVLTGKDIISCFSPDSGITVYDRDIWWSNQWDSLKYGLDYNYNESFFAQFYKLLRIAPMPAVFNGKSTRSSYCNHIGEFKDGYLVSASWDGENIMYASRCHHSKDCVDVFAGANCELSYEVVNSRKLYNVFFAQNSEDCNHCAFIYDCRGCSNVFASTNLRNKQYYIYNKPYSKKEYFQKLKDFDLGSRHGVEKLKNDFSDFKKKILRKYANFSNVTNVTGDNISHAYNCQYCFDIADDVRDCKFLINSVFNLTDSYDGYGCGVETQLLYEAMDSGLQATHICFVCVVWGGYDIHYSYNCHGCSNLFGCIGLRNKQYCILNKQYTKEEYEKLVPRIIEHMNTMPYTDAKGRIYKYGEFFPPELSPFAYNETIAQEYFPLTKEQALEQGYRWKEPEEKQHTPTISWRDLPDNIKDVSDSILDEAILCSAWDADAEKAQEHNCTKVFRIIPQELEFYRKMNLPLPRYCPNSRHFHRIQQRNPLRLWHRKCMCQGAQTDADFTQIGAESQRISAFGQRESALPYINTANHFHGANHCPNEFETSYAPDRPEIVYCEQCYQSEIV